MTTKLSHIADHIQVNDEITLRAKTAHGYETFAQVVVDSIDHLSPWMPWAINAPEPSSLEHYTNAPKEKQNNESLNWDIFYNENFSGAIGVYKRESTGTILEIGYWLTYDAVGKGIVSTCVKKISNILFEETDAKALEIGCDIKNKKSAAVAQRAGFFFDRKFGPREESPHVIEGLMFKLTREQWERSKKKN